MVVGARTAKGVLKGTNQQSGVLGLASGLCSFLLLFLVLGLVRFRAGSPFIGLFLLLIGSSYNVRGEPEVERMGKGTFAATTTSFFLASFSAFLALPDSFFALDPLGGMLLVLARKVESGGW